MNVPRDHAFARAGASTRHLLHGDGVYACRTLEHDHPRLCVSLNRRLSNAYRRDSSHLSRLLRRRPRRTLEDAIATLAQKISSSAQEQKKRKIAVLPFDEAEGRKTVLATYIPETLVTNLFQLGRFEIVERHSRKGNRRAADAEMGKERSTRKRRRKSARSPVSKRLLLARSPSSWSISPSTAGSSTRPPPRYSGLQRRSSQKTRT